MAGALFFVMGNSAAGLFGVLGYGQVDDGQGSWVFTANIKEVKEKDARALREGTCDVVG